MTTLSDDLKKRIEKDFSNYLVATEGIEYPYKSQQENIQWAESEAFKAGATPWASKLEAIRAEIRERMNEWRTPDEGTPQEVRSRIGARYQESKEILSIIDKHLAK